MGKLIIFVGPSGSGKSNFAQYLIDNFGAIKIVSTTSRKPREGEIPDINYHFVSTEEFEKMIEENKFIEFAKYSTSYYGTTKAEIEEKINSADLVVNVMEIGGAQYIKKLFPETILIFCSAYVDVLMQRMYDRGDSFEEIKKRIRNYVDCKEADNAQYTDFILDNNGNIENSYNQLKEILCL